MKENIDKEIMKKCRKGYIHLKKSAKHFSKSRKNNCKDFKNKNQYRVCLILLSKHNRQESTTTVKHYANHLSPIKGGKSDEEQEKDSSKK